MKLACRHVGGELSKVNYCGRTQLPHWGRGLAVWKRRAHAEHERVRTHFCALPLSFLGVTVYDLGL